MALSKIGHPSPMECNKPLLQKWGRMVTKRIFASSCLDAQVKRTLVNVVDAIRCDEAPEIYVKEQCVPEMLCCLPYLLGFVCEINYIHQTQVDLHKPILVVSNAPHNMTCLMDALSTQSKGSTQPALQSKGILDKLDIERGVQYRTCVVKKRSDIAKYIKSTEEYDVVLSTNNCAQLLPHHGFSLVIGQEDWCHIAPYKKLLLHNSVILLKYLSQQNDSTDPLEQDEDACLGPILVRLARMIGTGQLPTPLLYKNHMRPVEVMMNRIMDITCNHIPIEFDMVSDMGLKEFISALPFLLGEAALKDSKCLDLSKPVLFLAMDVGAYQAVADGLPRKALDLGRSKTSEYRWNELLDEFQICTYSRDICDVDVVLTTMESMSSGDNNVVTKNDFYKEFRKDDFAVVIVIQTKCFPVRMENEIISQFGELTTIFVRTNAKIDGELDEYGIWVRSKLSTIYRYGADAIVPELMVHGEDITERYLICKNSVLTDCQQAGLSAMVDWFGRPESFNEAAYVSTAIGYKYAGMMIWCLPSMLEWADKNHLITNGAVNLHKPLLVLCKDEQAVSDMWFLLHSHDAFHQSSLFVSNQRCSDGMGRSYIVIDVKSAENARNRAGDYKVVIANMEYLEHLGNDGFSEVVVFTDNLISTDDENVIMTKFRGLAKVMFFAAGPIGPLKRFLLQTTSQVLLERERQEVLCALGEIAGAAHKSLDILDSLQEATEDSYLADSSEELKMDESTLGICSIPLEAVGAQLIAVSRQYLKDLTITSGDTVEESFDKGKIEGQCTKYETEAAEIKLSGDVVPSKSVGKAIVPVVSLDDEQFSVGRGRRIRRSWLRSGKGCKKIHTALLNSREKEEQSSTCRTGVAELKPSAEVLSMESRIGQRTKRDWLNSGIGQKKVHASSLTSGEMEEQSTVHGREVGELEVLADVLPSESVKGTVVPRVSLENGHSSIGHGPKIKRAWLKSPKGWKKVHTGMVSSSEMKEQSSKGRMDAAEPEPADVVPSSTKGTVAPVVSLENGRIGQRTKRAWLKSGKRHKKVHPSSLTSGEMEEQPTVHRREAGELELSADVVPPESAEQIVAPVVSIENGHSFVGHGHRIKRAWLKSGKGQKKAHTAPLNSIEEQSNACGIEAAEVELLPNVAPSKSAEETVTPVSSLENGNSVIGHGLRMKRSWLKSGKKQRKSHPPLPISSEMKEQSTTCTMKVTELEPSAVVASSESVERSIAPVVSLENGHSSIGHGQKIKRAWLKSGKKQRKSHPPPPSSSEMKEQSTTCTMTVTELEPSAVVASSESVERSIAPVVSIENGHSSIGHGQKIKRAWLKSGKGQRKVHISSLPPLNSSEMEGKSAMYRTEDAGMELSAGVAPSELAKGTVVPVVSDENGHSSIGLGQTIKRFWLRSGRGQRTVHIPSLPPLNSSEMEEQSAIYKTEDAGMELSAGVAPSELTKEAVVPVVSVENGKSSIGQGRTIKRAWLKSGKGQRKVHIPSLPPLNSSEIEERAEDARMELSAGVPPSELAKGTVVPVVSVENGNSSIGQGRTIKRSWLKSGKGEKQSYTTSFKNASHDTSCEGVGKLIGAVTTCGTEQISEQQTTVESPTCVTISSSCRQKRRSQFFEKKNKVGVAPFQVSFAGVSIGTTDDETEHPIALVHATKPSTQQMSDQVITDEGMKILTGEKNAKDKTHTNSNSTELSHSMSNSNGKKDMEDCDIVLVVAVTPPDSDRSTWSEPVVYLSNNIPWFSKACCCDDEVKNAENSPAPDVSLGSVGSLVWDEPSSIDVISLGRKNISASVDAMVLDIEEIFCGFGDTGEEEASVKDIGKVDAGVQDVGKVNGDVHDIEEIVQDIENVNDSAMEPGPVAAHPDVQTLSGMGNDAVTAGKAGRGTKIMKLLKTFTKSLKACCCDDEVKNSETSPAPDVSLGSVGSLVWDEPSSIDVISLGRKKFSASMDVLTGDLAFQDADAPLQGTDVDAMVLDMEEIFCGFGDTGEVEASVKDVRKVDAGVQDVGKVNGDVHDIEEIVQDIENINDSAMEPGPVAAHPDVQTLSGMGNDAVTAGKAGSGTKIMKLPTTFTKSLKACCCDDEVKNAEASPAPDVSLGSVGSLVWDEPSSIDVISLGRKNISASMDVLTGDLAFQDADAPLQGTDVDAMVLDIEEIFCGFGDTGEVEASVKDIGKVDAGVQDVGKVNGDVHDIEEIVQDIENVNDSAMEPGPVAAHPDAQTLSGMGSDTVTAGKAGSGTKITKLLTTFTKSLKACCCDDEVKNAEASPAPDVSLGSVGSLVWDEPSSIDVISLGRKNISASMDVLTGDLAFQDADAPLQGTDVDAMVLDIEEIFCGFGDTGEVEASGKDIGKVDTGVQDVGKVNGDVHDIEEIVQDIENVNDSAMEPGPVAAHPDAQTLSGMGSDAVTAGKAGRGTKITKLLKTFTKSLINLMIYLCIGNCIKNSAHSA